MTTKPAPARTLELEVDVDAPLETVWKALTEGPGIANWFAPRASVDRPGAGGEVTLSFGEAMTWTVRVDAWEPGKHVRWIDENGFLGPGTVLAVDYHLSTVQGKTRVRLVQSGFGESEGWDDFFTGVECGWRYFLFNLREYLERHLGQVRHMISERFEITAPREKVWKHLLSTAAGLVIASGVARTGDWVQLQLSKDPPVRASVEMVLEGHVLALRIPELGDALLFVELEVGGETFGVGFWLSVYDATHAARIEATAKEGFLGVKATFR